MTSDRPAFGLLLRRLRIAAGLTQQELAERSGLSVRGISDLERGARERPRHDTVEMLTDALELDERQHAELVAAARERPASDADDGGQLPPSNLPQPLTSLVGRDADVANVLRLFEQDGVRLVTLVGPGGVGKTRLALQVARELRSSFPDGAFFVSLAALRDPALVADSIAHEVGLREASDAPEVIRLTNFLSARHTLLLLDNFEHLLPAASLVSDLLASCPHLAILATSRTLLRLSGEHLYDVQPLSLPGQPDLNDVDQFLSVPSVALFLDRRSALVPTLGLDDQEARAVAEICGQLDGLPLAIELAAARCRSLSLPELAGRLSHRLALLTGGPRDLPGRQQTLRDTIAWSYELLTPDQRRLFRWLSVFSGGWTLEAAEDLAAEIERRSGDLLDHLTALVEGSLVQAGSGSDGFTRYGLLETIREFAEEQLQASGDAERARERQVEVVVAFSERAERGLQSGERTSWSRRSNDELDNVRAALHRVVTHNQTELALRLIGNLDWFWDAVGRDREGWDWSQKVLAMPGIDRSGWSYGRALSAAGALAWNMGEFQQSEDLLREGVDILRHSDDRRSLGQVLINLGLTLLYQGDAAAARRALEESITQLDEADDTWGLAIAHFALGEAQVAGDPDAARAAYERSLALFRSVDEPWGIAHAMSGLGGLAMRQRDYAAARSLMEEGLALRREIGNRHAVATSLVSLGELARRMGDLARADGLLEDGLQRFRELGDSEHVAWALFNLGMVSLRRRDGDAAMSAFVECLNLRATQGNAAQIANAISGMTGAAALLAEDETAARLLGAADALRAALHVDIQLEESGALEREALAAIRSSLGEERAEALLAEGHRLSLNDAVSLARDVAERWERNELRSKREGGVARPGRPPADSQ